MPRPDQRAGEPPDDEEEEEAGGEETADYNSGGPPGPQTTREERRQRVEYMQCFVEQGLATCNCLHFFRQRFPVNDRTAADYLAKARKAIAIAEAAVLDPKEEYARSVSFWRGILRGPYAVGVRMKARQILDHLLALTPPIELRVGGSEQAGPIRTRAEEDLAGATVEELKQLRELRRSIDARRKADAAERKGA